MSSETKPGLCALHPCRVAYPTSQWAHDAVVEMEKAGYVARAFKCDDCGCWHVEYAEEKSNK